MEIIPKRMGYKHRLIYFLVAVLILLENNITAFLIVASFIEGYILTESTDYIFNLYLFISNPSSLYFRSDYWTLVMRE